MTVHLHTAPRAGLRRSASLIALSLAALSASPALAQTVPTPGDDVTEVDAVEVVGFRQSLNRSSDDKRRADQVVDVITAEEFGKFPDQNVAESIQRIPGISMERAEGEGDKITIRGLEPDLTRVEINGRSTLMMGNSEAPNNASSLSVFGSDQFAKIEIVKSAQAKDDEGGVGGIVRLITARPLDVGRAGRVSIQGRYNEYSGKTDPVYSLTASNVFLNDTLGVLLSASYDDRTRRNDQTRNQNGWQPAPKSQTGDAGVVGLRDHVYSTHFDQQVRVGSLPRTNVDMTVQYRPSTEFELYINGNYAHEERRDYIARAAINTARNRPFIEGSINEETGTVDYVLVDKGQFTFQNRALNRATDSYGLTINPKWENDRWILSARADYSMGQQIGYDRRIRSRMNRDVGYDLRADPRVPIMVVPGLNLTDLSAFKIDMNLNEYGKVRSEEISYQADVTRKLERGFFTELSAGLKVRENRMEAAQGPASGPTTYTFADAVSPFPVKDFFKDNGPEGFLTIWPYVDAQAFVDEFGPSEADARAAIDPALTYEVQYDSVAAYGQAAFEHELSWASLRGNVGTRVVRTDFTGEGFENFKGGSTSVRPVSSSNSFTNVLPSANLAIEAYAVDGLIMRLAAGRVMTRPRFTEINPTAVLNEDDLTISRGNAELSPFLANQYDIGIEYYFGSGNMISLALFHKDISNFVEPYSLTEEYAFPGQAPEDVLVTTYRNGGEGKVSGVEFSLQTPFTFLPAPFDGFGGIFNYTQLESSRTLADGSKVEIPGNSPKTANATIYYEKGGFSARVAYNYRDTFLKEQFGPGGNPIYVEGQGRIDLSAGYRWDTGLTLTANVANLTEENRYEYSGQPDRVMLYQLEGRMITLGLSYTF